MTIELRIHATDGDHLREQLRSLLGEYTPVEDTNATPAEAVAEDAKPRAKRRTKAQIAADELAATPQQPADAEPESLKHTVDDVKSALEDLMMSSPDAAPQMVDLLTQLGALNAEKHPKISALDPAKYEECIGKANRKAAENRAAKDAAESVLG